jgi:hypothetical protein
VPQDELNQPVAEAANAVVKNDRIGVGSRHPMLAIMLPDYRSAPATHQQTVTKCARDW